MSEVAIDVASAGEGEEEEDPRIHRAVGPAYKKYVQKL